MPIVKTPTPTVFSLEVVEDKMELFPFKAQKGILGLLGKKKSMKDQSRKEENQISVKTPGLG